MNQPLKSTSTRLCSQRAERRLRAREVPVVVDPGADCHQKRHGWTISPKLCSRDLE